MKYQLNQRELELITTGLYLLESQCIAEELPHEIVSDLGGIPDPTDVRTLMDRLKEK